jgi:ribosome assembly protein RRB1
MPKGKRARSVGKEEEDEPKVDTPQKVRDPAAKTRTAQAAVAQGAAAAEEFEDQWDDEFEEEDIVGSDEEIEDDEDEEDQLKPVFRPGIDKLEPGEVMDYEPGTYEMMHSAQVNWPCLSFDVMTDSLGVARAKYPMTAYVVAGTQAEPGQDCHLVVMKWSQLHKTKHDGAEDSDDESSDEEADEDAALDFRMVKHEGTVNRVRCMPQAAHVVATWSEKGVVHIWDVESERQCLDPGPGTKPEPNPAPLFSFKGHSDEGYGMAWSPATPGRFLSSGCDGQIFLWEPKEGGWSVGKAPYRGHDGSVEDVQWKRAGDGTGDTFASAGVDGTVRLWDARQGPGQHPLVMKVHDCDVNVLSWNPVVGDLLLTGGDDGSFKCWDVRFPNEVMASFSWHQQPVTSVDWHPTDETVLAVASADDTISLWDMSVEDDHRGELPPGAEHYPAQLLFLHMGQTDIKELRWAPQLPGVCISTAGSGFNIFKTANLA